MAFEKPDNKEGEFAGFKRIAIHAPTPLTRRPTLLGFSLAGLGAKLLPSGAVIVVEVDAQGGILMGVAKVPCLFGLAIAI